jgi:hypothetical protein
MDRIGQDFTANLNDGENYPAGNSFFDDYL